MNKRIKIEILSHAVRWAANMVVEAVGNYGCDMSEETRDCLHAASHALHDAMNSLRQEED